MFRLTLRIVSILIIFGGVWACSKKRNTFNPEEAAFRDGNPQLPDGSRAPENAVREALAAASANLDDDEGAPDSTLTLRCPETRDWQKLAAFAAPCGYVWTTDTQKLPIAPEWQPCSPMEGLPRGTCRQFKRNGHTTAFHLGPNDAKEMQIGFVEACGTDQQIVIADIDGPSRVALRRAEMTTPANTCQVKLLAVDLGQWLATLGGAVVFQEYNTSGHTIGGAIFGGAIGVAPSILHSSTDPFHVATSQGAIQADGWSADGKRRSWTGKPLAKAPQIGMVRLTKRLLVDEKKGFFADKKKEVETLFEVPKGHTISGIQIRDKQIVWQDESNERGGKTSALYAGEIDADESLSLPRRIIAMPCSPAQFVLGCNTVLRETETHLALISLTKSTAHTLHLKGHPLAVDCNEAFVEHAGALLRIDLQAFHATKALDVPLPNATSAAERH